MTCRGGGLSIDRQMIKVIVYSFLGGVFIIALCLAILLGFQMFFGWYV
jgi:hypothetical protein